MHKKSLQLKSDLFHRIFFSSLSFVYCFKHTEFVLGSLIFVMILEHLTKMVIIYVHSGRQQRWKLNKLCRCIKCTVASLLFILKSTWTYLFAYLVTNFSPSRRLPLSHSFLFLTLFSLPLLFHCVYAMLSKEFFFLLLLDENKYCTWSRQTKTHC